MKLKHASIFSLLTFPLEDILAHYSISSLQDGMVIFIKKVGLRVGLKDLINIFQVGLIIKSKEEGLFLWDCQIKQEGRVRFKGQGLRKDPVIQDLESQTYFFPPEGNWEELNTEMKEVGGEMVF